MADLNTRQWLQKWTDWENNIILQQEQNHSEWKKHFSLTVSIKTMDWLSSQFGLFYCNVLRSSCKHSIFPLYFYANVNLNIYMDSIFLDRLCLMKMVKILNFLHKKIFGCGNCLVVHGLQTVNPPPSVGDLQLETLQMQQGKHFQHFCSQSDWY